MSVIQTVKRIVVRAAATMSELIGVGSAKVDCTDPHCKACGCRIEAGTFYCAPCSKGRPCRTCGGDTDVERVRLLNSRTCIKCAEGQDNSSSSKRVLATREYIQDELIPDSAFRPSAHMEGDVVTPAGVVVVDKAWYKRRGMKPPTQGFTTRRQRKSKKNGAWRGYVPDGAPEGKGNGYRHILTQAQWKVYQSNKDPLNVEVR